MNKMSNEELEPAAWEYDAVQYGPDGRQEIKMASEDRHPTWPGEEPLVRVSDVRELLDEVFDRVQETVIDWGETNTAALAEENLHDRLSADKSAVMSLVDAVLQENEEFVEDAENE